MGLFSKLFKKKNSIVNATQSKTFDNPECQKFWSLKTYIDDLLSESKYIAKSEYRPRLLEEKKTIEYFAVLDNSGMLQSFCKNNGIDIKDVESTLNRYRNFEALVDEHNENFIVRSMHEDKLYLDNILREVDPKIVLDEDQRRVVLTDEDYCLVIAGAGA